MIVYRKVIRQYVKAIYDYNTDTMSKSLRVISVAEASTPPLYSEHFEDSNGDTWVRSFLINTKRNDRSWQISPLTVRSNIRSIIGKPFIMYKDPQTGKLDHHPWNTLMSSDANIRSQEQFAVGRAERVFHDDKSDNYYVDIKVTDPQAKAYLRSFKERNVPLPVSPQILWPQDGINRDDYITNWSFAHVAAVHSGAYGPDSKILHTCDGTYDSCSKQFENIAVASASSCDSDPDYPYFPAPTRYHAILNNIVDAAVAAARARGIGIAVASYEPDVSESKSESAGSASASTNRLRRVYPESEIPSSFRDKLQAPSNGKRPRKLV